MKQTYKRIFITLLLLGLCVGGVQASTQLNYTASKGGVFNGGFETGTGTATASGWVGSENYGWYDLHGFVGEILYDANQSHTGTKSMKFYIPTANSGAYGYISENNPGWSIPTWKSHIVPLKPSTVYKYSAWVKTDSVSNTYGGGATILGLVMDSSNTVLSEITIFSGLTGTRDWTPYNSTFTTGSTAVYWVDNLGVTKESGSVWFDDITLEEVVTDTQLTAKIVKPVVQGVTSTDNIDQFLDSGWAATNTYALGTTVSETATGWQAFTPTKNHITNISIYCVATGTAATWTMLVHDASNNTVSSNTFTPVTGVNTIQVPALWTSGNYHFHVISSTTTGTPTLKAGTSNDMDTASYIQYFAKSTESASITVNGVNLNISTNDATGLLSGAIVDLDKGYYNWSSDVSTTAGGLAFAPAVYSTTQSTRAGYTNPFIIAGWGGLGSHLATNKPIVIKVNTMLPAEQVYLSTNYWGDSQPRIYNWSLDGVTWTEFVRGTTTGAGWKPLTGSFTPNSATFYIQTYSTSAINNVEFQYLSINATLNTTSLNGITQTIVPGTNTYLFSSNGQANSSSLDPSLQMNVWLIEGAATVVTTLSPSSGVAPLLVTFNETYSGLLPDSYYWEFGDGATSTDKNTTHTYTTIGTFDVNHRIMNGSIISWANTTSAVTVLGGSVTANFTANVTAGDYPLYVQFTDTSTYINATPSSWYWTFGDGLTSTSQNPSHTYSNAGTYSVNFTTTTDYGESSKLRSAYISVGGVAANGRQDVILTNTNNIVTLYIKDATSGNLITHAAVSDEMGNELTSYGNGIFSGSYSTGQHTFTANATDYYNNRATYLISGDLIQTIYLTQVASSVSTTWYTPKTIVISFVDAYGNQVRGASVNARFNETTLPNGVSDLISNYGMNVNIANEALNGTLLMSGSTDYQGSIVFTMLSALKYDIAITYNGETNYYSIYPQDSQYQFRFLTTVATDNIWDDLYANGNTKVWATEPDPSNVTFWWSFQDMTSLTTRVDFYLKDVDLDTMVYITNVTSPVAGNIYQLNYTVPNVRGKNYLVWGNYTRDV